jgi:hypothetical protein
MKKLIFLALLCLSFVAAHAGPQILNHTNCPLQLTPVCYDPQQCAYSACGPVVVIPPSSAVPLPPPCGCPAPLLQGYVLCYIQICPNLCTTISDAAGGPCANFPITTTLQPCRQCGNAILTISWDSFGNMVIM